MSAVFATSGSSEFKIQSAQAQSNDGFIRQLRKLSTAYISGIDVDIAGTNETDIDNTDRFAVIQANFQNAEHMRGSGITNDASNDANVTCNWPIDQTEC
jgi:hypothetical protein